ncbi:hypothetical protein AHAS_Ahas15G0245300 [Arachis hypogaea]
MRLVSMVVEGYIEEGVHRDMVGVVNNHKEVHHSHCLGMHHGMTLVHSMLDGVVAKRVYHKHMAPPTFDCPILDASCHCNSHFLQHS